MAMNQNPHTSLPAFIVLPPKDIAAHAYEIYLQRGASDGFDSDDWLRAEQELKELGLGDIGSQLDVIEAAGDLDHEKVVPLLAPYIAGKLRRQQAEAVRRHVAVCAKCTRKIGKRVIRRAAVK